MAKNHFALKCFLNWLIGQLVFLGRVSRDFTIWTSMWHLVCNFYPRVLQWVHIITKKSYKLHFIQKILFGATPTLKFGRNGQKPNFWQEGRRDSIFLPKWPHLNSKIMCHGQKSFCPKMLPWWVNWPNNDFQPISAKWTICLLLLFIYNISETPCLF